MTENNSILVRLKLVDYLQMEIPMEKKVFIEKLKENVDEGDAAAIVSFFEMFSSSAKEYKGSVGIDSFKLRRRRKFFDHSLNAVMAEGNFRQKENSVVVTSTIKGFRRIFIPFIALIAFIYVGSVFSVLLSDSAEDMVWFFIPFIFVHAFLMLGIPYFIIRRGVAKMKYDLERDLYFLTR